MTKWVPERRGIFACTPETCGNYNLKNDSNYCVIAVGQDQVVHILKEKLDVSFEYVPLKEDSERK